MPNDAHPQIGTWYILEFRHSGKALTVAGASSDAGANVVQAGGAELHQQWKFLPVGDSGFHVIRARHSGRLLSVEGAASEDKANVSVAGRSAGEDETHTHWSVTHSEAGYVELRARHSGKCLEVGGSELGDDANVRQYGVEAKKRRRLELEAVFEPDRLAWYRLRFVLSGEVLSLPARNLVDLEPVVPRRDRGSASQEWSFEEVERGWYLVRARHSAKLLTVGEDGEACQRDALESPAAGQHWALIRARGGFELRARGSSLSLGVEGSAGSGAKLVEAAASAKFHSHLHVELVRDVEPERWYRLMFVHSRTALSVGGGVGNTGEHINVDHGDYRGLANQHWALEEVERGWYLVRACHSEKVLTVSSASTEANASVEQLSVEGEHGDHHQHWALSRDHGGYLLRARHSRRLLGAAGAGTRASTVAQRGREANDRNRLRLKVVPELAANSWHSLHFEHSGKALCATQDGLVQSAHARHPQQQWRFELISKGSARYRVRPRHMMERPLTFDPQTQRLAVMEPEGSSSKRTWLLEGKGEAFVMRSLGAPEGCIRVVDESRDEHATVVHSESAEVQGLVARAHPRAPAFAPEPGAWYTIRFAHSGKVLSVADAGPRSRANIEQARNLEASHQLWRFVHIEGDRYQLRVRHSGHAMRISDESRAQGGNIEQYSSYPTAPYQQWSIVRHGDAYRIRSVPTGLSLEVEQGSLEEQANVHQWGTDPCQHGLVHITRVADPVLEVPPKAIRFTASAGSIRLPPLQLSRTITIQMWVKPEQWDEGDHSDCLLELGSWTNEARLRLLRMNGRRIGLRSLEPGDGSRHAVFCKSEPVLEPGRWTHVLVTIEYSRAAWWTEGIGTNTVALYIGNPSDEAGDPQGYALTHVVTHSYEDGTIEGREPVLNDHGWGLTKVLGQTVLDRCALGATHEGTQAFRGDIAELRITRAEASEAWTYTTWARRVCSNAYAYHYRLDEIVDGRVLDHGAVGAHGRVGPDHSVVDASGLELLGASAGPGVARTEVRCRLRRERLPRAVCDEASDRIRASFEALELGVWESPEADHFLGRAIGGAVETTVFDVTLTARDGQGGVVVGRMLSFRLSKAQVVIVDDADGVPTFELWPPGWHALPVSDCGSSRLRILAKGLSAGGIYVRHAGMPKGVWQVVRAEEATLSKLRGCSGTSMREPGAGRFSPFRGSVSEGSAGDFARVVGGLARVIGPAPKAEQAESSARSNLGEVIIGGAEQLWQDISKATFRALDGGEVVWGEVVSAGELVSNNIGTLVNEAIGQAPRPSIGAAALLEEIGRAEKLAVVVAEDASALVGELDGVVHLVGYYFENELPRYWRIVIATAEDAALAITAILERVGASLQGLLDYLTDLFNWDRVLERADAMYEEVRDALGQASAVVDELAPLGSQIYELAREQPSTPHLERSIEELVGGVVGAVPGNGTVDLVLDQLERVLGSAKLDFDFPLPELSLSFAEELIEPLEQSLSRLTSLAISPDEIMSVPCRTLFEQAQGLFVDTDGDGAQTPTQLVESLDSIQDTIADAVAVVIDSFAKVLTERIDIPWLTDLVEATVLSKSDGTRYDLDVLRLVTLLAAVVAQASEEADTNTDTRLGELRLDDDDDDLAEEEEASTQHSIAFRQHTKIVDALGIANWLLGSVRSFVAATSVEDTFQGRDPVACLTCIHSALLVVLGLFDVLRFRVAEGGAAAGEPEMEEVDGAMIFTGGILNITHGAVTFAGSLSNSDIPAILEGVIGAGWVTLMGVGLARGSRAPEDLGQEMIYWPISCGLGGYAGYMKAKANDTDNPESLRWRLEAGKMLAYQGFANMAGALEGSIMTYAVKGD